MIAAASFIVVLLVSVLVVRVAVVALALTGMTRESAQFQARSAWTGTGFATSEAEAVVTHPVRRRIISTLMVLRGAGLVTAITALLLSLGGPEGALARPSWELVGKLALIVGGLLVLVGLARSRKVDRVLTRAIRHWLRRIGHIESSDLATLYHVGGDYEVCELAVRQGDWLAGRRLGELGLADEGVLVLGVERTGGRFIGAFRGDLRLEPGDVLVAYGRLGALRRLDQRSADFAGQAEHYRAARAQRRIERREERGAQHAEADVRARDASAAA